MVTASKENTAQALERQLRAASKVFDERVENDAVMCRIYDVFVGDEADAHNCLGCNLKDLSEQISRLLSLEAGNCSGDKPHYSVSEYVSLLNTLWERVTDVLDILGVPVEYRARHFETFHRVRRWANFFKHPKEFAWIVHHPKFLIEHTESLKSYLAKTTDALVVDDEFLKKFYMCDKPKGLRTRLEASREKIVVVLPDVEALTIGVCTCIHDFVEMITENPIYQELLADRTTIADFFERNCEAFE